MSIAQDEETTQVELVREYFMEHPNEDIPHKISVPWLTEEYKNRTGKTFADPDRQIRSLKDHGFLIKVNKGVYRYDPDLVTELAPEDFTESQKEEIKRNDGYKCVICGLGIESGVELHVDHIKPRSQGGRAIIENGQTLCSKHNFMKKNLNQTTTGKKMFIHLYNLAKKEGNEEILLFAAEVLRVFERFGINGHIPWEEE